ncbi:MAG: ATP-binding protein [Syntrophales bacterium]|nr:ATP-binding protein [Syntrophales bacterium]
MENAMIERPGYLEQIHFQFEIHPVVAVLGSRQCGKTTLAEMYADRYVSQPVIRFDLEDPTHLARLDSPKLALEGLRGLVVIDEVQRAPGLFEVLRVLADRRDNPARFLILGSASRDLLRQSSETLAGRIGYIELAPFSLLEVGTDRSDRLWLYGGFPPSFMAKTEHAAAAWRQAYISTFLERDIPSLGFSIPPAALRRFWMMLAHYHGQTVNYSEIGRSFGASDNTVRNYLDILESTFMIRQLPPWHENIGKRQVKSAKMYIRDSGILHSLIGIEEKKDLMFHPKLGPSWEGFAIESIIGLHRAGPGNCYFWATHGGAELDLLIFDRGRRVGYEIKHTDSPRMTRSLAIAQRDLTIDEMYVVYPGSEMFPLDERVQAVGLETLVRDKRDA